MRAVILSRRRDLYSTRRLFEACEQSGLETSVVDPLHLDCALGEVGPGSAEDIGDLFLVRPGTRAWEHTVSVARQLELGQGTVVNRADAIVAARDKFGVLQRAGAAGIPVANSNLSWIHEGTSHESLAVGLEPYPVVVKLRYGTQGVGAKLVESLEELTTIVDTWSALGRDLILQRFYADAAGQDVRVFVIGGEVAATVRRTAADGEWRANVHLGGRTESADVDPAFHRYAVQAVELCGLAYGSVDFLETVHGPRLLEVNASPGLQGIEGATGVDLAGQIVQHAVSLTAQSQ